MTIYLIKKDKHTTVRTAQLHEARKIAKQVLINRLKEKCDNTMYLVSTSEKMYVYSGETQIRLSATMSKRMGGMKTYSVTIKCLSVTENGYDLNLHTEIHNGYYNVKGAE